MSWKARSTSVISSRPERGGLSGFPSANRRALSRRTSSRWMIPWRNSRARMSVETTIARAADDERPDLPRPRTCGGPPSAGGPAPPPRRGPRRWSPRTASSSSAPRPSPASARSRSPARTSRSSSATQSRKASIRPASSAIRGALPRVVRDQLPQLLELRRHPPQGGLGPPGGRADREDQAADARVALDEAAVQLLDLGDDVLGVDGPLLGVV